MRYGSPVLELAAGTGRIAVPIALAGVETVRLDAVAGLPHVEPSRIGKNLTELILSKDSIP
jgi:hypothetical protein